MTCRRFLFKKCSPMFNLDFNNYKMDDESIDVLFDYAEDLGDALSKLVLEKKCNNVEYVRLNSSFVALILRLMGVSCCIVALQANVLSISIEAFTGDLLSEIIANFIYYHVHHLTFCLMLSLFNVVYSKTFKGVTNVETVVWCLVDIMGVLLLFMCFFILGSYQCVMWGSLLDFNLGDNVSVKWSTY
uniref:hypothetical protein n=1 Tax=Sphaeromyxa zaharoni TaxID=275449 RepID=UPI003002D1EF